MEEKTYYYYFDCLDGIIGEQYLTARELTTLLHGSDRETLTEKQIKSEALNYEATLYRYEKSEDGSYTNGACIYDTYGLEKTYTKTECGSWNKD